MDETYSDFTLPRAAWAVALTGMLVPAERHREIRARFYGALAQVVGSKPGIVPAFQEVHAAALFPLSNDDDRIAFLQEMASLITEFDLSLYRVGYVRSRDLLAMNGSDKSILGLCFGGILELLKPELERSSIWPVMETDRTDEQDKTFPAQIQLSDYFESHVGSDVMSRDSRNLGEVLYSTKRSIHGSIVDCAAYLLNVRTVAGLGLPLSPFKQRIHEVAKTLAPAVRFDEVIKMRFNRPPKGHQPTGPYRFAFRITPSDTHDI